MEKILQNIVKIIIVGILYDSKVFCSRGFLPPIPYYQNDPYYIPSFITPYQEYVPVYIQPNAPPPPPPPISYHNSNAYTRHLTPPKTYHPPQLFYKNENYHPLPPPGINYPVTPFPSQPHNYKTAPYTDQQKVNYEALKKPTLQQPKPPQEQQKAQVYTSNIILKDETYPPYYQDEYKNYHEDDYTDNYTDDAPVQKDPCTNSPYRNFEPGPVPNGGGTYTLCNPYFQPNFGNSVYTVKAPITLLPSRFPPRVEEFVQRIQNYFSTYTEKETPKPDNETSTISPPSNETASESHVQVEDVNRTNITEIQQLEQAPVMSQTNDTEKVTIELEFVGKKTPGDEEETTKATDAVPTTEQPQNIQETTAQSETTQHENTTVEVRTAEPTAEEKMEANVTTPENEILQQVTDTNG